MSIGDIALLSRQEGVCGGDACIHGTRLRVELIADRFVAGESFIEIAGDYDVYDGAIIQALRLVLYARGTSLRTQRAAEKIAKVLPLQQRSQ